MGQGTVRWGLVRRGVAGMVRSVRAWSGAVVYGRHGEAGLGEAGSGAVCFGSAGKLWCAEARQGVVCSGVAG